MTDPQRLADATLLPCPFCGEPGATIEIGKRFYPVCYGKRDADGVPPEQECLLVSPPDSPAHWFETRAEAITAWNTRSHEAGQLKFGDILLETSVSESTDAEKLERIKREADDGLMNAGPDVFGIKLNIIRSILLERRQDNVSKRWVIAASDALRSSTTALEIGRAMERERCAKVCEGSEPPYLLGERPVAATPESQEIADQMYKYLTATRAILALAIRSAAPEIDMEALVEKVAKAAFYSGATDRAWDDCRAPEGWRRMARAVLATLTARQQEK